MSKWLIFIHLPIWLSTININPSWKCWTSPLSTSSVIGSASPFCWDCSALDFAKIQSPSKCSHTCVSGYPLPSSSTSLFLLLATEFSSSKPITQLIVSLWVCAVAASFCLIYFSYAFQSILFPFYWPSVGHDGPLYTILACLVLAPPFSVQATLGFSEISYHFPPLPRFISM